MFRRLSEQDYYQILEVDYGASPEDIQSAYEAAREVYSSDCLISASILTAEERRQILQRVTEAYNTLIAEESRRLYDERLAEKTARTDLFSAQGSEPELDAAGGGASALAQPCPRLIKGSASREAGGSRLQLSPREEATGEFLRRARESAGLALRSIAEDTKIGVTMLAYIEEERVERLPAAVYLRNFVAQYARCLGLEEERVARTYLARIRRLQSRSGGS